MIHPSLTSFLVGFDQARASFENLVTQNQLPHGILLSGPRGIGKATFAYHLARFLLKGAKGPFEVESSDPLFKRVAAGAQGDLMVLEQKPDSTGKISKEIGVDSARRVVEFFSKTSLDGGWRVAILDSIDQMNRQAANALLKVLEEPPQKSVLILISHHLGKVSPTLYSRCRPFRFSSLSLQDTEKVLEQKLDDVTPNVLRGLGILGEGRPGSALRLHQVGGLDFYKNFMDTLQALGENNASRRFSFVEKYLDQKLEGFEENLASFFQEFMQNWLARVVGQMARGSLTKTPEVIPGEHNVIQAFMAQRPLAQWVDLWQTSEALFQNARRFNLDQRQVLTQALGNFARH